ncbi:hypothetical protein [Candidatus Formimonas warabiya]|uniref:Uncharacterized protein n=1 Tax=Formimonas warabiya TaxID=1761012 RepID=A0A3G1KZ22_FORW1|nr:hypothetical protein [Candidatus Formimonas warabiya]ATW27630.1 hypothetical protein DCMF_25305 [Candidatus Formimonas warabiya]
MTKLLTLCKNSTLDRYDLFVYYEKEINALQKQGSARQYKQRGFKGQINGQEITMKVSDGMNPDQTSWFFYFLHDFKFPVSLAGPEVRLPSFMLAGARHTSCQTFYNNGRCP